MSKYYDLKQLYDLSVEEREALTKSVNYNIKNSDSGIGYIFENADTGTKVWSPKKVKGISGKDLLDFNILRLIP